MTKNATKTNSNIFLSVLKGLVNRTTVNRMEILDALNRSEMARN